MLWVAMLVHGLGYALRSSDIQLASRYAAFRLQLLRLDLLRAASAGGSRGNVLLILHESHT